MQKTNSLKWINTDRYPIDQPDSEALQTTIADVRVQLKARGCAVLKNFIAPALLPDMAREAAALSPLAYFTHAEATVYGGEPDPGFPDGHPRNCILKRENGFVAGDFIAPTTGLRQTYHSPELKRFLAQCLDVAEVHEFGDPLAQLVINVVKPNDKHVWHFDSNEFVVSVLTQPAEQGGEFEYVPNVRSAEGENYEAVQAVIEGNCSDTHLIDLRPGDLQIFFGRYSVHRVRATSGSRDRHTAILAYSKQPGVLGKPEKTAKIFGRKLASHDAPENQRPREDQLTD
ncbi:MAG: hypothetical protein ABI343_06160 [Burkholderiaceae bacterium]